MTTRRRKKHRPEDVVAKLRDADAMLNASKDLAAVLQALEVSESTLKRERAPLRRDEVRGSQEAEALGR
jgi:putative transposase